MKRYLIPLVCVLALSGCTSLQIDMVRQCGGALLASRVTTAADLFMVAQTSPACMALGVDAMQEAVRLAMLQRGIR